jgi:hypothetical protein
MRFDATVQDWGTVRDASITDLEHTFRLRNVGGSPLIIHSVAPSCGCTIAELQKRTIAPGETAEIVARLHLAAAGQTSSEIRLATNVGDATLSLRALREPLAVASCEPRVLEIGEDLSGALVVRVWTLFDTPFAVADISTRGDRLSATSGPATRAPAEKTYVTTEFALRVVAAPARSAWNDELTVRFSDARIPPLFIPVHVEPAPSRDRAPGRT